MIAALLPKAEGNPAAMLRLAQFMRKDGQLEAAHMLCRRVLALVPANSELAARARQFWSETVPSWHFNIVRDERRNAAYDAALRRAVGPQSRVLEIGTGSGILAMMAARAGAAAVVTCEMTPEIADLAKEVIALNGYADRVRVVAKHSDKLDVIADLGGRADILVSEIVSNNLLQENVLPAHERAVRDLLKPGGVVIPAGGRIRVALADDAEMERVRLGTIAGFDLSPFNRAQRSAWRIEVGEARLTLHSEAADLFTFDFASGDYCAPARTSVVCHSTGGRVSGIAQWMALQLDAETGYENRPEPGAISCWAVLFYPLPQPIDTVPGQPFRIFGAHDRYRPAIWAEAV